MSSPIVQNILVNQQVSKVLTRPNQRCTSKKRMALASTNFHEIDGGALATENELNLYKKAKKNVFNAENFSRY